MEAARWATENTQAEEALTRNRSQVQEDEETARMIHDLLSAEAGNEETEQADEDMAVAMRLQSAYDNEVCLPPPPPPPLCLPSTNHPRHQGSAGSAQVSNLRSSRRNHGGTTVGAGGAFGTGAATAGAGAVLAGDAVANDHAEFAPRGNTKKGNNRQLLRKEKKNAKKLEAHISASQRVAQGEDDATAALVRQLDEEINPERHVSGAGRL